MMFPAPELFAMIGKVGGQVKMLGPIVGPHRNISSHQKIPEEGIPLKRHAW